MNAAVEQVSELGAIVRAADGDVTPFQVRSSTSDSETSTVILRAMMETGPDRYSESRVGTDGWSRFRYRWDVAGGKRWCQLETWHAGRGWISVCDRLFSELATPLTSLESLLTEAMAVLA